MVAISLYKGNLHKAPNVPHRWPKPTPKISLKDFKILLRRRARALSRLQSDVAPNSNPNPNHSNGNPISSDKASNGNGDCNRGDNSGSEPELKWDLKEVKREKDEGVKEEGKVAEEGLGDGEESLRKLVEETDALLEKEKNEGNGGISGVLVVEKRDTEIAISDVEKRGKEVKEKLEILNEKKHSLVQVLKQILSAEEQLKRQNSTQGLPGRPPLPLQVDTTTDSGSITRINTPRMGSDGNPCGDVEGGEADDVSNQNMSSRHLPRMSSTSPSSESQQWKLASNMVPHSYRTTMGVAGSPSRFAPGGQGQSSVSVSGASYAASTPSPAASGGTSVFRDGRLPSPWN